MSAAVPSPPLRCCEDCAPIASPHTAVRCRLLLHLGSPSSVACDCELVVGVSEIFEGKAATIAALQAQLEEAHRENEVLRGAVAALAAQVGVVAAGDADTDSAAATSSPAPPPAATPRVPSRGGVDDDRDAGRASPSIALQALYEERESLVQHSANIARQKVCAMLSRGVHRCGIIPSQCDEPTAMLVVSQSCTSRGVWGVCRRRLRRSSRRSARSSIDRAVACRHSACRGVTVAAVSSWLCGGAACVRL